MPRASSSRVSSSHQLHSEHKQRVTRSPLPLVGLRGDVVPPALVQVNMCVIATCLGVCSQGNIDFLLNAKSRTTAPSLTRGKLTKSSGCFSFPRFSLECPWLGGEKKKHHAKGWPVPGQLVRSLKDGEVRGAMETCCYT